MAELPGLSLYFHIPFCLSRCHYCDFNSYAGLGWLIPQYVDALQREMQLYAKAARQFEVKTAYFGGGTPSLLPQEAVARILEISATLFHASPEMEVTLEANPGTVKPSFLAQLRQSGVNRLSLGVQSFSNTELGLLGRIHSAAEARAAYRAARQAGFQNINIDLLYALPRQTIKEWQNNLAAALRLAPDHLSLYPLTLEPDTPLSNAVAAGSLPQPDADLAADIYLLASDHLAREGYTHYEISNWALPGKECRHNLTYWKNGAYLGFGVGAHSHLGGYRWANILSPTEYVANLDRAKTSKAQQPGFLTPVTGSIEPIDRNLEIAESVILGLRLEEGIGFASFTHRFGIELPDLYRQQIKELTGVGLIAADGRGIRLTPRGRLLGNEVFLRFLPQYSALGESRPANLPC
jgi:oxygen-independent coproporphyrinogen-3 oxidase